MSNTTEANSDHEFIERFKRGDQTAFDALVDRYAGRAFQIAYGVLGSREDAEEVAQDVFVRVHRALGKFRGDAEFTTWMYRIALNLARNKYRWNKCRGSQRNISLDAPVEGREDSSPGTELASESLQPDQEMTRD